MQKFSKKHLTFKVLFLIFVIKVENNHKKFHSKTFEWQMKIDLEI